MKMYNAEIKMAVKAASNFLYRNPAQMQKEMGFKKLGLGLFLTRQPQLCG